MMKYKIASSLDEKTAYYGLLTTIYQKFILDDFVISKQEIAYNEANAHIIIALEENTVIGGARVIVSTPNKPIQLPLESEPSFLEKALPELGLKNKIYGEWGRLVVKPDITEKRVVAEYITRLCVDLCVKSHCRYLFGLPLAALNRRYQEIFAGLHLNFDRVLSLEQGPSHAIHKDLDVFIAMTDLSHRVANLPIKSDYFDNQT